EAWFLAHEIDYPSDNEKELDMGAFLISRRGMLGRMKMMTNILWKKIDTCQGNNENEDQLTSRNYDSWQDRNSTGNSQTGHSSCEDQDTVKHVVKGRDAESGGLKFGGFSFPSPSRTSDAIERDDILASW
ncbi:hypothetical protein KI387_000930, partial [Taxus chinensis]